MTNRLKQKLANINEIGTKNDKVLCKTLFKSNSMFYSIKELESLSGIPSSTIHRFGKKLGYPSFKHFLYAFRGIESIDESFSIDHPDKELSMREIGEMISEKFTGKVHLIASQRTTGILSLLSKQFKLSSPNYRFYNEDENLKDFVDEVGEEDTIFLTSLTGHSLVLSKSISWIAEKIYKNKNNKPTKIIILTASKELHLFDDYDFVDVVLLNHKYSLSNWTEYIDAIQSLIKIVAYSIMSTENK